MTIALTTVAVNNIQTLNDLPNDVTGLTSAQLKTAFDKYGADNNNYINTVLIPALIASNISNLAVSGLSSTDVQSALVELKTQLNNTVLGTQPDGSLTDVKLSNLAGMIKDTVTVHIADVSLAHGINNYALKAQQAWISPVLTNGWVNYGPSPQYPSAAYYKDTMGIVHLQGMVKNGTNSQPVFTLPVGYRPVSYLPFSVVAVDLFGEATVEASGSVKLMVGSNGWFSLQGDFVQGRSLTSKEMIKWLMAHQ